MGYDFLENPKQISRIINRFLLNDCDGYRNYPMNKKFYFISYFILHFLQHDNYLHTLKRRVIFYNLNKKMYNRNNRLCLNVLSCKYLHLFSFYYLLNNYLKGMASMTNLFVIGNGFDLDHNLKTSYNDFRKYLLSEYAEIKMDEMIIPSGSYLQDGGVEYDDVEVLSMLFYLINQAENNYEKWSNIEKSLGYLDFSEAFEFYDDILDDDGDTDWWKTAYRNEEIASQLVIPTFKIQEFFWEWIHTINLDSVTPKRDFNNLINEKDKFLTFNYTETLEVVYGISSKNICHIHGKQHEEIFFGHGNNKDYYEEYMSSHIGSENSISKIYDFLRKDTTRALEKNIDFFDGLVNEDICNIFSYGFSFNEVDSIYIEELCKRIKTENITWYFNDYDISNIGHYIQYVKKCGFSGNFNIFHIGG